MDCLNLKSGGMASEALPTITENTATLLSEAQIQDDDRDPFADLDDDEEELETDELIIEDFTCRLLYYIIIYIYHLLK